MMILYGSEACTSCKQVRKILDEKHLEYEYVDIKEVGYKGQIPVIFIGEEKVVGLGKINNFIKSIYTQTTYSKS